MKPARPTTKRHITVFKQVCELIPSYLIPRLAKEFEIDARSFSPTSHVFALLYGQYTAASGLNDICDGLDIYSSNLRAIRGATPPRRNTFSNANRTRPCEMAEKLYWSTLEHLTTLNHTFGEGKRLSGYLRRFNHSIYAMDSTTIQLVLNSFDWAQHRRRKAAAKCHMNLNLNNALPHFAVVGKAKTHDKNTAAELCATLESGEIAIFDRAYVDYSFLNNLNERGVFWVSRSKCNMKYKVVEQLNTSSHKEILVDELIELTGVKTAKKYPHPLRRVVAMVEVRGKKKQMAFITNNLQWSAWTVAELFRARWKIETFFRELKQTVQLVDFVGYNENAVQWQIWTALLVHLLVRYLAHLSRWGHAFKRLFVLIRSALWKNFDLIPFLESYGTADRPCRLRSTGEQSYLPGFNAPADFPVGQPKSTRRSKKAEYRNIMQGKN